MNKDEYDYERHDETGGPAFPNPRKSWDHQSGMTLRDYFAAQAMRHMSWQYKQASAKACYEIADAMLDVR
jgi:hypothetical protein